MYLGWAQRKVVELICSWNCVVAIIFVNRSSAVGLDRTVVSMMHCGCIDPGSIPGLDKFCHVRLRHKVLFFLFAKIWLAL